MKISLLSNVNVETIAKKLQDNEEDRIYHPSGYGLWLQELLNMDSKLYGFSPESIFIILDGEELIKDVPNLELKDIEAKFEEYYNYLHNIAVKNKDKFFIISNIDLPEVRLQPLKEARKEKKVEYLWYEKLIELNQLENIYIFDLKKIIEEIGRINFYSSKLWYLGGIKFSVKAENYIIQEINRFKKAIKGKKKKCIVLDLDNTLWGGVVGEEGIENIELSESKEGARYKDFQKKLKDMKEMGILLAIVSKNNEEDALEVFRKHPHMVLKEDDFVIKKINWNLKAENLKEISEDLNIGLDSLVFIDDNPIERESVKQALPEIIVPDFPGDTSNLKKFAETLYYDYFTVLKLTKEDKEKTMMYKQNAERSKTKKTSASFEEFLKNLEIKIYIWKAQEEDIARIAQLTQKTNQFNLTTKRYTEKDIRNFIESNNYEVYVASVKDKFGDNGKVSVLIVKKEGETAEIDTFLMSCRVMGNFIEDQIITFVEESLLKDQVRKINASYIKTKKNEPVKDLFERLGYNLIKNEGQNKYYQLDLSNLEKVKSKRKYFGELISQ
ncbi:MAG TPA: HAD-IIIC family phosphatase [Defluviitaleaceae bacterium]|nr:HAD-IIIC family phosphatase [Defluviitaleaceae bacterium]